MEYLVNIFVLICIVVITYLIKNILLKFVAYFHYYKNNFLANG